MNYEVQRLYNIWRYFDVSTSFLSMIGLLIGIIDVSIIKFMLKYIDGILVVVRS